MTALNDEAPDEDGSQPSRRAMIADDEESHRRDHRLGDGFAPTQFDEFFKDDADDEIDDAEATAEARSTN